MSASNSPDWLGELPSSWDLVPSWSLYRRVKRTGHATEELLSVYRDHGVVPKSSRDDNHNVESEDLSGYQLVRQGDLVMNKMKAWQGSIALSEYQGIVSPAYFVFQPLHDGHLKYFHYLLRSQQYIGAYNRISKGVRVGQWDLDPAYFRTLPIPVPPIDEQRAIADFLDRELAHIDRLIEAQQSLPILLNARYNAQLISATTRGLDPDEEFVNSGLEWAPRKPKNWTVKPFFTVGREISQKNGNSQESNLLSLSYGEVIEKDIDTNEGLLPASFDSYQIINPGNLVFRLTDLQNDKRSLRSALSSHKGIITSAYLAVQVSGVEPEFLAFQMRAWDLLKVFYSMGSGLRQSMKYEDLRRMPVVLPSLKEQQAIVRYLTQMNKSKNEIISETAKAVSLLKERRAALINAAVTGKIDVWGKN